jgi:hypothetical protein
MCLLKRCGLYFILELVLCRISCIWIYMYGIQVELSMFYWWEMGKMPKFRPTNRIWGASLGRERDNTTPAAYCVIRSPKPCGTCLSTAPSQSKFGMRFWHGCVCRAARQETRTNPSSLAGGGKTTDAQTSLQRARICSTTPAMDDLKA